MRTQWKVELLETFEDHMRQPVQVVRVTSSSPGAFDLGVQVWVDSRGCAKCQECSNSVALRTDCKHARAAARWARSRKR